MLNYGSFLQCPAYLFSRKSNNEEKIRVQDRFTNLEYSIRMQRVRKHQTKTWRKRIIKRVNQILVFRWRAWLYFKKRSDFSWNWRRSIDWNPSKSHPSFARLSKRCNIRELLTHQWYSIRGTKLNQIAKMYARSM